MRIDRSPPFPACSATSGWHQHAVRLAGQYRCARSRTCWPRCPPTSIRPSRWPVRHYLTLHHHPARHALFAIGIATTVSGDQVQMTNHRGNFSIAALQAEMGLELLVVISDFTAALGLPSLGSHGTASGGWRRGGGWRSANGVGPGTRLSVSGLFHAGGAAGCRSPGRAATSSWRLMRVSRRCCSGSAERFGHTSAERGARAEPGQPVRSR